LTGSTLVASSLAITGAELMNPRRGVAQTQLTPDEALAELLAGNQRFRSGHRIADGEDLAILRQHTQEKQEPFAAVLSCSDSRVPVEIIFDQSIGHIFVTRVAGNIVTPEIIASLEYGAVVLGVKAILVLGHANCGAVEAAMTGKKAPGRIDALYSHLQSAIDEAGSNLDLAIRANARIQGALLHRSSTVIAGLVKEHALEVASGYYDVARGEVTLLE
jgi:carbonic anhydrase